MTRIEVTSNDDMTEAYLMITVPEGAYQAHVIFHMESEEDVRREAAVQEVEAYYLPHEGTGAKSTHARYQENGVDVDIMGPVDPS